MNEVLLSIDPGVSTGIALLSVPDESEGKPVSLIAGWQFRGGLAGFLNWRGYFSASEDLSEIRANGKSYLVDWVIAEKFSPINHSDYALTLDSVEPLRIEGSLITIGAMSDYQKENWFWRRPIEQYIFGGKTKAEKKKLQHRWLKEHGFYLSGKDLGAKDADDFRSATAHGISFAVKVLEHKATWKLVSEGV